MKIILIIVFTQFTMVSLVSRFTALTDARLYVTVLAVDIMTGIGTIGPIKPSRRTSLKYKFFKGFRQ